MTAASVTAELSAGVAMHAARLVLGRRRMDQILRSMASAINLCQDSKGCPSRHRNTLTNHGQAKIASQGTTRDSWTHQIPQSDMGGLWGCKCRWHVSWTFETVTMTRGGTGLKFLGVDQPIDI